MVVQWLRLCIPNAGDTGSIHGQGTKIPHAAWAQPKKNQKKNPNRIPGSSLLWDSGKEKKKKIGNYTK